MADAVVGGAAPVDTATTDVKPDNNVHVRYRRYHYNDEGRRQANVYEHRRIHHGGRGGERIPQNLAKNVKYVVAVVTGSSLQAYF